MRSKLNLGVNIPESKLLPLLHRFIDQILQNISNESHDHYLLTISRENDVKIVPNSRSFQIISVFNGEISGKGILKKVKASGLVSVDLAITYQIYDQNKLQLHTNIINASWVDKPKLHLGLGTMSIEKVANLLLDKAIKKATVKFDELSKERIDMSKLLTPYLSNVKSMPIPINDQILYLNIDDLIISIGDINLQENLFTLPLHIDSSILINDDNSIKDVESNDIPFPMNILLMDDSAFENRKLVIPLHLPYDFLNELLVKKVNGRTFDILNKKITITDIALNYLDSKTVLLYVETNENILERMELSFAPFFNNQEQTIKLENLQIHLKKTNFLGRSLMLVDNLIEKIILKRINPILLKPLLSEIEQIINQKVQEKAVKHGFSVDIDQQGILIESLKFNNDYLDIEVSSILEISVSLDMI